MNPSNDQRRTQPITIPSARARARTVSISESSSSSSSSGSSLPIPNTPPSSRIQIPSSPILSYFLTQSPSSPTSTNNTLPFRKFGTTSVFEAEDEERSKIPANFHARRASAAIASKFTQQASPDTHTERANNLLRRLSLGGPSPQKPLMDQPVTTAPKSKSIDVTPPTQKPRRSATISNTNRPRRAPSPMGERILKGHFDGFN